MSSTPQSAQDDLAFLRSLVGAADGVQRSFGETYLAAGLCYGAQFVLSAAQMQAWLPGDASWSLAIGFVPTAIFLLLLVWFLWRGRQAAPTGVVGRAITAAFAWIGVANLALIVVIGSVALRQHSITTWLIYPCVVYVLQGVAWMVAFALRRRAWLGLVAAGWFIAGVVMALCVQSLSDYILAAGVGMLLCMVVPGAVMVRLARTRA
jgi:hypothetical protein